MSDEFKEKLKSLQFNAKGRTKGRTWVDKVTKTEHVEQIHEDTGQVGGTVSEKWDGSQSSKITGAQIKVDPGFAESVQQEMRDAIADSKPGRSYK